MDKFFEPLKDSILIKVIIAIITFLISLVSNAQVDKTSELYKTLQSKDSIIFERAFNKCESEKLNDIIAEDFEFYHDIAGFDEREAFFNSIKNGICKNPGNIERNLVENSLEVYPLLNNNVLYGAIQKGKHTFKENQQGNLKVVVIADFTHVSILEQNTWKLKRVLSYNHNPYSATK